MNPSWRKPFGVLLIILIIVVWATAIASLSPWIGALPRVIEVLIYLAAGIVWIFPLKPLLLWMETGKWRE